MVIGCVDLLWFDFDWESPRTCWLIMYKWMDLRSWALGSNEFAKLSCISWLWARNPSSALGERPSVFPVPVGTRGEWLCGMWIEIVGDKCNVCGSVAFSYVLMRLDGQVNITIFRMILSEFSWYDFEPNFSKWLRQSTADGCQIKGPARWAICRCQ